jgi:hypothetical protein
VSILQPTNAIEFLRYMNFASLYYKLFVTL